MSPPGCYYFGTFNPIHMGHLLIAEMAWRQYCQPRGIGAVTFVPAGNPPHKSQDLAEARDRLVMARLATASNPHFRVSDVELRFSGPTYSIDILEALEPDAIAGGRKIPFVLGADAFGTLPDWHRAARLAEIAHFILAPRPGVLPDWAMRIEGRPLATQPLVMPELEVSSSWLREQLRAGHAVRYLIPDPVRRYIQDNRLYRPA